MFFSSWLRKWNRSAPTVRRRTRKSPRQRANFRPRVEALEERLTPSTTINVTDTSGGMDNPANVTLASLDLNQKEKEVGVH